MAICKYRPCQKEAVAKGEPGYPFCSHDCGIGDYYLRKDEEYKAEYAAWAAQDPETRGPFEPKTYFD